MSGPNRVERPPCLGIWMTPEELESVETTGNCDSIINAGVRPCVLCVMFHVCCVLVVDNLCQPNPDSKTSFIPPGSFVQPFTVLIDEPGGYFKEYRVPEGASSINLSNPFLQPDASRLRWKLQDAPNASMWVIDQSVMVFDVSSDLIVNTNNPVVDASMQLADAAVSMGGMDVRSIETPSVDQYMK